MGFIGFNQSTISNPLRRFKDYSDLLANGAPLANGGSVIVDSTKNYRLHSFTSSGNITFTQPGTVEYLIVAGGGGGGTTYQSGQWGQGGDRKSVV
jgi:hypothetical protein